MSAIKIEVELIESFFFQAEDGIRDRNVTGVQTCALPILWLWAGLQRGEGCWSECATRLCRELRLGRSLLHLLLGRSRRRDDRNRDDSGTAVYSSEHSAGISGAGESGNRRWRPPEIGFSSQSRGSVVRGICHLGL